MVDEAKRLREEKVADLAVKEARRDELEAVKVEKEREKEAAEVPEREALDFYRRVEEEERRKQEEQEKEAADAEAAGLLVARVVIPSPHGNLREVLGA